MRPRPLLPHAHRHPGLNPLGLEVKLSGHVYLIFYPLGFAMPVTQLKGAPFAFAQFRTTLGLEVTF